MFSLLSPFSLWMVSALAIPLAIHFLGRQKQKQVLFPSLLLIKTQFSKSMQKHKLKNILLLILRILLLLCLLLALAQPVLESHSAFQTKPDYTVTVVHNGIYSRLLEQKLESDKKSDPKMISETNFDKPSATGPKINSINFPLIENLNQSSTQIHERYGDYRLALLRLKNSLATGELSKSGAGNNSTILLQIPIFSWMDLNPCTSILQTILKDYPRLQIEWIDHHALGNRAQAFQDVKIQNLANGFNLILRANLNSQSNDRESALFKTLDKPAIIQTSLQGKLFQEAPVENGNLDVTIPLDREKFTTGKLSLSQGNFAANDFYFCFPKAEEFHLAHSGKTLTSLPSLGSNIGSSMGANKSVGIGKNAPTNFRKISHYSSGKEIPWAKAQLVFLGLENNPETLIQALEFVKKGGHLILTVGANADIPLLNRLLLEPLRLGHLGSLQSDSSNQNALVQKSALDKMGNFPDQLGAMGHAKKFFTFLPESETQILIQQKNAQQPLLVYRQFHKGKVLLWTTDLDDLDWTDLGLYPITPLIHQAFQSSPSLTSAHGSQTSAFDSRMHNISIAADSILSLNLAELFSQNPEINETNALGSKKTSAGGDLEILDPEGNIFSGIHQDGQDGSRIQIGPFDKLGIYQILQSGQISNFAVNLGPQLALISPLKNQNSMEEISASANKKIRPENWEAANEKAKEECLNALQPFKNRLSIQSDQASFQGGSSGFSLWPWLYLAAILLLFTEGLIASFFSLKRTQT